MTGGSRSSAEPPARAGLSPASLEAIDRHLRQREHRREQLYERARRLRRLAQGTMNRLHTDGAATSELAEVRSTMAELAAWLRQDGRGDEPLASDALQEAVEASLLGAIVAGEALPGPAELGVDPEPFLLGLWDVVGEVRRLVLDRLGREEFSTASELVRLMEELTGELMRFDTTRAIVQLKPKQDAARGLLERTRGDLVLARYLSRLPPAGGTA